VDLSRWERACSAHLNAECRVPPLPRRGGRRLRRLGGSGVQSAKVRFGEFSPRPSPPEEEREKRKAVREQATIACWSGRVQSAEWGAKNAECREMACWLTQFQVEMVLIPGPAEFQQWTSGAKGGWLRKGGLHPRRRRSDRRRDVFRGRRDVRR
jgi:hypothetical protein